MSKEFSSVLPTSASTFALWKCPALLEPWWQEQNKWGPLDLAYEQATHNYILILRLLFKLFKITMRWECLKHAALLTKKHLYGLHMEYLDSRCTGHVLALMESRRHSHFLYRCDKEVQLTTTINIKMGLLLRLATNAQNASTSFATTFGEGNNIYAYIDVISGSMGTRRQTKPKPHSHAHTNNKTELLQGWPSRAMHFSPVWVGESDCLRK